MNQILKPDRDAEEIARIRAIVARHALPGLVTGFDVQLGEFNGDPAMWVKFHTVEEAPGTEAFEQQIAQMSALRESVQTDLLADIDNRFPFFRFD